MDSMWNNANWQETAEGEAYLQHLHGLKPSQRRLFGILEKPMRNCSLDEVSYKLVFLGRAAVGKTLAIGLLATGCSHSAPGHETIGLRITDIYWPVKVWEKVILFKLQCWDAGNNSMKKFQHIQSSCLEKADCIVFTFSYSDRTSFSQLSLAINKFRTDKDDQPEFIILGIRDQSKTEVSYAEVKEFEESHSIPILTLHTNCRGPGSIDSGNLAPILNAICEKLLSRDQQYILRQAGKI